MQQMHPLPQMYILLTHKVVESSTRNNGIRNRERLHAKLNCFNEVLKEGK